MSKLREALLRVAEKTAGCQLEHIESVPVVETREGKTIWEGVVEVFGIKDVEALRVYAWAAEGDKEPQLVTVINKWPVKSPLDAVRAWIDGQAEE